MSAHIASNPLLAAYFSSKIICISYPLIKEAIEHRVTQCPLVTPHI